MQRLIPFIMLLFTLSTAHAALLIEPVVGYNFGKGDFEGNEAFDEISLNANGVGFGGRLGYQYLGLQLGLDYLSSTLDLGDKSFKKSARTSEFGAFVGFEFPVFFRVYGGYIFSATGETETDNDEYEFTEGSGPKVGIGFTGFPIIDVNLEYRRISYGKVEESGAEKEIDVYYNAIFLGLSAPFTF